LGDAFAVAPIDSKQPKGLKATLGQKRERVTGRQSNSSIGDL
jgi:hypothetical protein